MNDSKLFPILIKYIYKKSSVREDFFAIAATVPSQVQNNPFGGSV